MSNEFNNSATLYSHRLKQQRLVAEVSISADATPADKEHGSDIPGALVLRSEGKISEADAIDDLSAIVTTADDGTGVFAVLLDVNASKLYKVSVTPDVGTVAVTASGLTSDGRIYLDLDSNQDFSSQGVSFLLEIEYKEKR